METKRIGRRRRWIYRLAAMLLVPMVLIALEGAFRLFDRGAASYVVMDPGFSGAHSLFIKNETGERYAIRPSRLRSFAPESFAVQKAPREFRIFCLGGSTVQGRPYSIETSFTTWLELGLNAADPDHSWEVINGGGVSYASYRLVPIFQECLGYEPDLIILCTGHNEFLEDRTFAAQRQAPRSINWMHETLLRSRVFSRLRGGTLTMEGAESVDVTNEVDAFLDHPNGLKAYHRDLNWRQRVLEDFAGSVRRMLVLAEQAKVPVLVLQPPSNLRDSPPFKSEHRAGLSDSEQRAWSDLVAQAKSQYETNLPRAIQLLQQALVIDPVFAETHYTLGKYYEAQGLARLARQAYLQAREQDVCPLRMLTPMEADLDRIARDFNVPRVNLHELLERESQWNILGNEWLLDHVHPTIRGHQLIAARLLKTMAAQGWVQPRGDWQRRQEEAVRRHFQSLGPLYYPRGQQRLENLRAWTQGRAGGPWIEPGQE